MGEDIFTVRDHFLSLFQSAADEVAHRAAGVEPGAGRRLGLDNDIVRAAAKLAELKTGGLEAPELAPEGVDQDAWTCAKLALELMEAKATGDTTSAERLENELKASPCDPGWADTIIQYLEFFGPDGTRRAIPYVRAATVGATVLEIKPDACVAVIGDWGTGMSGAVRVLQDIQNRNPDVVIHLGDIYYSGTADECTEHFLEIVDGVFDRAHTKIPVFTLSGNHDMYSGGVGYYELIKKLNAPPLRQPASFFCLRSTDKKWQWLAMDTGLHDYNPFSVGDAVTFLEPDEEQWLLDRITGFPGRTILLSHHQLFSAFSKIGPPAPDGSLNPRNPKLLASFNKFKAAGRIAAWFWGHEHNLCIFEPYAGLDFGRCIGHGAVPVLISEDPYQVPAGMKNAPKVVANTGLATQDQVYAHGYAFVSLAGDKANVQYFQFGAAKELIFSEVI